MTSRRSFTAGMLGLPAVAASQARKPRPNVLFIAVDDLRPDLGCYGSPNIKSPNIDALARQGTVFTRAYCQQAVCSPSRTSLLTGLRPDTTKVYELQTHFRKNLPDVVTLPQRFRESGYATTGLGKIYHGGLDDSRSWSIPSWVPGPNRPAWNTPANAERNAERDRELAAMNMKQTAGGAPRSARGPSWAAPDVGDDDLNDGKTAATAIGALRSLKDGPFFLAVGFLKPHLPFIAPKRYFDLYPRDKVEAVDYPEAPANVPPVALHNSGELRNYNDIPQKGEISEEKRLDLVRAYFASASYTDAQIGRVIGELDRLGLRENTVVVLWGDHGYHLGDHGLWNKHSNFEKAVHVPLVVSAPGQKKRGAGTSALTEFVDIYPSLCELCGVQAAEGLEGTSFAPLLNDPGRRWKPAAFSQYPRNVAGVGPVMGHSIRTERYRLTEWLPDEPGKFREVELYDYRKDPNESANVAGKPENGSLVAKLTEQLHAGWRAARPPLAKGL